MSLQFKPKRIYDMQNPRVLSAYTRAAKRALRRRDEAVQKLDKERFDSINILDSELRLTERLAAETMRQIVEPAQAVFDQVYKPAQDKSNPAVQSAREMLDATLREALEKKTAELLAVHELTRGKVSAPVKDHCDSRTEAAELNHRQTVAQAGQTYLASVQESEDRFKQETAECTSIFAEVHARAKADFDATMAAASKKHEDKANIIQSKYWERRDAIESSFKAARLRRIKLWTDYLNVAQKTADALKTEL
ncbi:MAG: hypothetical protein IPL73_06495 [Candidatus Obscuribacter sp.]|nr:hypothetical protein [Candidatus Obscuribacter sp.]